MLNLAKNDVLLAAPPQKQMELMGFGRPVWILTPFAPRTNIETGIPQSGMGHGQKVDAGADPRPTVKC